MDTAVHFKLPVSFFYGEAGGGAGPVEQGENGHADGGLNGPPVGGQQA